MKVQAFASLAMSAALAAAPALAGDHAFYATGVTADGEAVFFVDKPSIVTEANGTRLARIDIVYNGASARENVKHVQSVVRVDCSMKMVASLGSLTYDGNGRLLTATAWEGKGYVIPFEDAYRRTAAFVCNDGKDASLSGDKPLADQASLVGAADRIYRQFPG